MEITGVQQLSLAQDVVWQALNDADMLRQCIPGCESIELIAQHEYRVTMSISVGPVKARFNGKMSMLNIVAPQSYDIVFEGNGGAAGFGKGTAKVALDAAESGGTTLAYSAKAQVGGKIAQVGARLIDAVARKLAEEFFARFQRNLEPVTPAEPAPDAAHACAPDSVAKRLLRGWRKS